MFSPADRGATRTREGSGHDGHLQSPVSQQAAGSCQEAERDDVIGRTIDDRRWWKSHQL